MDAFPDEHPCLRSRLPALPGGGRTPVRPAAGGHDGLNVDGVNFNNMAFTGEIHPRFAVPCAFLLNPTFHTPLSAWALGEAPIFRRVEIMVINGLTGNVSVVAPQWQINQWTGEALALPIYRQSYELRLASDGLPFEVISIGTPPEP